jgi:biotin carboxyl carrier protein
MSDKKPEFTTFILDDTTYQTRLTRKFKGRKAWKPPEPDKLRAHIPGTILKVHTSPGKAVKRGEALLVLEAMKMANNMASPSDGTVIAVHVKEGDIVPKGHVMVELKLK